MQNNVIHFRAVYKKVCMLASLLGVSMLCMSCTVGPDFKRPSAPQAERYTREPLTSTESTPMHGGESQNFILGADIVKEWWTIFGSVPMNNLIEQAFKHNPSIDSAQAALRIAQENRAAQFGLYFPTIQADYSPSRQKNAIGTISPTLTSGAPIYTLHTAQLSIGYALDIFGLNRRSVESLSAQAESQRFQLEAAYLTLASNVISSAIQEASLRAQISATQEIIEANTRTLNLLHNQAALGAASGLDIAAQETILLQSQQSLPSLVKQLEQTRNLLAVLAGEVPSNVVSESFDLAMFQLPQDLPISLPSKLIEHRPDVKAAEAIVHSASAQVGVAVASRLPQFSISALYGGTATQFSRMFASGDIFWGITGNVVQTIFDGGTLHHRQLAAEAALDQAKADYRTVVLTAFQNVADALYALDADAKSLKLAAAAETAADKSLRLTQAQLEAGAVNAIALFNAQTLYQQAKMTRIQAQAARYFDTVALFQALGGSWQLPSDYVAEFNH